MMTMMKAIPLLLPSTPFLLLPSPAAPCSAWPASPWRLLRRRAQEGFLRPGGLQFHHHAHTQLPELEHPDLRGREARPSEPGLPAHRRQQRTGQREEGLQPAVDVHVEVEFRVVCANTADGNARGTTVFVTANAGPLRPEEGQLFGQRRRRCDRLAVAALRADRRLDGQGVERNADRRALLRTVLCAARPLPGGGAGEEKTPRPRHLHRTAPHAPAPRLTAAPAESRPKSSLRPPRLQRASVDLPNRLWMNSTASSAVRLRTSSAGLISTTSSEASRPVSAIISMHSCISR